MIGFSCRRLVQDNINLEDFLAHDPMSLFLAGWCLVCFQDRSDGPAVLRDGIEPKIIQPREEATKQFYPQPFRVGAGIWTQGMWVAGAQSN
jgi:hypothetical protein